jgi:hypothetical protein
MKAIICSLLAAAILLAPCGPAIGAPVQKELKTEKVKPGGLKGFLKDSRGKPFSKVELSIVDEKGNVIQKAVTDANGEYTFTDLKEGTYTFRVAGKDAFKLEVTPAAAASSIQARLPSTVKDPKTGLVIADSLNALEWTLVVIGAVGVAIAVPAVIHHNDDDDDDDAGAPISP